MLQLQLEDTYLYSDPFVGPVLDNIKFVNNDWEAKYLDTC